MPQFTRAEAEALLPRVRPLLEDLKRRKATYDVRPSAPVASEIEALLREVAELGVEVKATGARRLDFVTDRGGGGGRWGGGGGAGRGGKRGGARCTGGSRAAEGTS